MRIIVGSYAAVLNGITLDSERPTDIDVWYSKGDKPDVAGWDMHEIPIFILQQMNGFRETEETHYATLDDLYTIKISHLPWSTPGWHKHKSDALKLLSNGARINWRLYTVLQDFWLKHYGNKDYLSLDRSADEFFDDHVNKKYDHDLLHEWVAFPNDPVYKECLKDGSEVLIDESKFRYMDIGGQVLMFLEEIIVIAFERWVIPSNGKISFKKAYPLALEKTVTRLTKGWASRFIVEHLSFYCKVPTQLGVIEKEIGIMSKSVNWNDFEVNASNDVGDVIDYFSYGYSVDSEPAVVKYKGELVEVVEHQAGYEGGGEYCYLVFKTESGKFFKIEYNYYSYDGENWDDATIKEVTPQQKTITVYE